MNGGCSMFNHECVLFQKTSLLADTCANEHMTGYAKCGSIIRDLHHATLTPTHNLAAHAAVLTALVRDMNVRVHCGKNTQAK